MKRTLQILLPLVVLLVGALGAFLMIKSRQEIKPEAIEYLPPLVRVQPMRPQEHRFIVRAQGTVTPRTDITLVPEVSGRVLEVSSSFTAGGFFEKGDVLITIDARDYELAVTRAGAQLADARVKLAREQAEADVARKEWKDLGTGTPNPLLLREPQLAEARAAIANAEAALEQAKRDLGRCVLRAPFAGRVWEKNVDAGQYVNKGSTAARIYAVDYAEVRLPLPTDELAYVDLPLEYRGDERAPAARVVLSAEIAGRSHRWDARIVRTEGEIDTRTRMLTAVARVDNPYGRGRDEERPPLSVGLFVQAEIQGHVTNGVFVVPRAAMRGKQLMAVDSDGHLRLRDIGLIRLERDVVVFHGGTEPGDRACVSPLDAPVDGMKVRTEDGDKAAGIAAAAPKETR